MGMGMGRGGPCGTTAAEPAEADEAPFLFVAVAVKV
jgi:hypothetical protein